jgi:hypothetical protein
MQTELQSEIEYPRRYDTMTLYSAMILVDYTIFTNSVILDYIHKRIEFKSYNRTAD